MNDLPDIKWSVPNMSEIARQAAGRLRDDITDLINKVRYNELMFFSTTEKSEAERFVMDYCVKRREIALLFREYRNVWKMAVGA